MKPAAPVVLLAIQFALGCAAQTQGRLPAKGLEAEPFRLSVDVDLVVLQATIRDPKGHAAPQLERKDFEVFEDGQPQPIRLFRHEDTPVTVGLIVDHSGSMHEKLPDVTAAAQAFVHFSNSRDQMFVVNFNEKVSLGLPQGMPFSDNVVQLGLAIGRAPSVGMTSLYDAIVEGLKRLQSGSSDKKVLIVISDGADNASKAGLDRVLLLAEQSSAMIYTIGIYEPDDQDANPKVLRRLAQETGGQAFFPAELKESVEICERIARDIRDQYTIGYESASAKMDGAYHKIRVTARAPGNGKMSVRARAGYSSAVEAPAVKNTAAK